MMNRVQPIPGLLGGLEFIRKRRAGSQEGTEGKSGHRKNGKGLGGRRGTRVTPCFTQDPLLPTLGHRFGQISSVDKAPWWVPLWPGPRREVALVPQEQGRQESVTAYVRPAPASDASCLLPLCA